MADKVGDEFSGFITGVAAFGFVELEKNFVEGLVPITSLEHDDYFYFREALPLGKEAPENAPACGPRQCTGGEVNLENDRWSLHCFRCGGGAFRPRR